MKGRGDEIRKHLLTNDKFLVALNDLFAQVSGDDGLFILLDDKEKEIFALNPIKGQKGKWELANLSSAVREKIENTASSIVNWTSAVIIMKGRELLNQSSVEVGIGALPCTLSAGIMKIIGQENEIQIQMKLFDMLNVLLSLIANCKLVVDEEETKVESSLKNSDEGLRRAHENIVEDLVFDVSGVSITLKSIKEVEGRWELSGEVFFAFIF